MSTVKLSRTRTKIRESGINAFVQVYVQKSQIWSAVRTTLTKVFRTEWSSSLAVSVGANIHRKRHISKC